MNFYFFYWRVFYNALFFATQQSDSVIHTYIYIYIYTHTNTLFHMIYMVFYCFITGHWILFPVLYSRTLLPIQCIHNNLHLLILNSQSIPPLKRCSLDFSTQRLSPSFENVICFVPKSTRTWGLTCLLIQKYIVPAMMELKF